MEHDVSEHTYKRTRVRARKDRKQYGDDGVTISELVALSNEDRKHNHNGASLTTRVCHPQLGHRRYIFLVIREDGI